MVRRTLLGVLIVAAAVVCSASAAGPAAPRLATVLGTPVSQQLYDTLLSISRHRAETAGASFNANQVTGARKLASAQASALRTAVRYTALESLASERGVTVSDGAIDDTISQLDQAIGAEASLDGQLSQAGMTKDDFRLLTRYRLLESRLRIQDPGLDQDLERLMAGDNVRIYAAPCESDHRYPQCLDAASA